MRQTNTDAKTLARINRIVDSRKSMIRLSLQACAHCALCAESCFKFRQSGGDVSYIRELAWDKCVLCMRCYCPIGISIPSLIAAARGACREKGVERWHTTRRNA